MCGEGVDTTCYGCYHKGMKDFVIHILYTVPAEFVILGSMVFFMAGFSLLAAISDAITSRSR
jgi:hypothetical protein